MLPFASNFALPVSSDHHGYGSTASEDISVELNMLSLILLLNYLQF